MNHHKFIKILGLKYHLQFWYLVIYQAILFIKQSCTVIEDTIFWNIFFTNSDQLQFFGREFMNYLSIA